MSNPFRFSPILVHLYVDEAFLFTKIQIPEDAPPEWHSAIAKVILAIKVARHIDTGLPLSEPLPDEPPPVTGWITNV